MRFYKLLAVAALAVSVLAGCAGVTGVGSNGVTLDKVGFDALFTEASQDIEAGRYLEAADKLRYIPQKHGKYDEARQMIETAENSFVDGAITFAEQSAQDGDYSVALETLQWSLELLPSDARLADRSAAISADYKNSYLSHAQDFVDANDYPQALRSIEDGLAVFENDATLVGQHDALLAAYRAYLLENARQSAQSSDYAAAVKWLETSPDLFADDKELGAQAVLAHANLRAQAMNGGVAYDMNILSDVIKILREGAERFDNGDIQALLAKYEGDYSAAMKNLVTASIESADAALATGDYEAAYAKINAGLYTLKDEPSLIAKRGEVDAAYKEYVLTHGVAATSDGFEAAVKLCAAGAARFPNDAEILARYRATVIARAAAEYAKGQNYVGAVAALKDVSGALVGDKEIAAEVAKYESYSPVALFKNGAITNEMSASALVPRTRAEFNEIMKMLYINNLNDTKSPVVGDSFDRSLLEQIKRGYENPTSEQPFMYEFEQSVKIVENKYLSYALFNEFYAEQTATAKDRLFYKNEFNGQTFNVRSYARVKLGTAFDFEITGGRLTGDTWWGGFTTETFSYQHTKSPAGERSGNVSSFVVNPDDGSIYFESGSLDDAGIFFADTENGKTVFNGIVIDRNKDSSNVLVEFVKLVQR